MFFHIFSLSVRQKLIALRNFENLGNLLKMSIPQKFLSIILSSWRARTVPIFYMVSRNVLKYSDFIFDVATTKNNKFRFCLFWWYVAYESQQLSKSLKFVEKFFFNTKEKFLDWQIFLNRLTHCSVSMWDKKSWF